MKGILLILLALVPAFVFAQDGQYNIVGSLGTYNSPAKVYIYHIYKEKNIIDSVTLANGKFSFSGTVGTDPIYAVLMFNAEGSGMLGYLNRDYVGVYLEKGTIAVTGTDSLSKSVIAGTKTNEDNKELMRKLSPFVVEDKKLDAEYQAASYTIKNIEAYKDELKKNRIRVQSGKKSVLISFILANPDSYLSLFALSSLGSKTADAVELRELYNGLSQQIKNSETAKVFKKKLDKWNITSIGAAAPDFTETDTNGQPVKLSSFRGKYILIDFWATGWCLPCSIENKGLVSVFNKYKNKKFTILGILYDRDINKEQWVDAIKRDSLSWPQVSGRNFQESEAVVLYDVESVPVFFLIDPNGKIIAKNLRGRELQNKLEEVLGK